MNERFKSLFAAIITLPASTLAVNQQPSTQLVPFAAGIGLAIERLTELKSLNKALIILRSKETVTVNESEQSKLSKTTKSYLSRIKNEKLPEQKKMLISLYKGTMLNILRRSLCEISGFCSVAYALKSDSSIKTTLMGFAGATFMGLLCDCIQSKTSKNPLNTSALTNHIKSLTPQEKVGT